MDITGTYGMFVDGIPSSVPIRGYIKASLMSRESKRRADRQAWGTFVPDQTGTWTLGLTVAGQGDLYVDGRLVVENSKNQKADVTFVSCLCLVSSLKFNTGTEERLGEIELEAGRSYQLEVRFSNFKQISAMSPYVSKQPILSSRSGWPAWSDSDRWQAQSRPARRNRHCS